MKIHILRPPTYAEGIRVEDDVDESELVKTEGVIDNDHERTTWVEYRFPGDDLIVHRSCHVTIKKGLEAAGETQRLDADGWAHGIVAELVQRRKGTGAPVELRGKFTSQEMDALRRALAAEGVGTLTAEG